MNIKVDQIVHVLSYRKNIAVNPFVKNTQHEIKMKLHVSTLNFINILLIIYTSASDTRF